MTRPTPIAPPPALVAHADWGTAPVKRWLARAALADGRYVAQAPEPVGDAGTLLRRLLDATNPSGAVLVGFDFPIGLPLRYAERAGVEDFLALLPRLGREEWGQFFDVAEERAGIGPRRPFYPRRPGGTRQRHLIEALGLATIDDLRRVCDRPHPHRRAASPLFWTLGAQQVGKAAIAGWRDVLAPGLRDPALGLAIWPFSGSLPALLRSDRIVAVETYPGEVYHHLRITWPRAATGLASGKRSQRARAANARILLDWAETVGVALDPALQRQIEAGFGPSPDGEDPFDAVVGLLGMLNVVLGRRAPGEPTDQRVRRVEGWILGQEARTVAHRACSSSED